VQNPWARIVRNKPERDVGFLGFRAHRNRIPSQRIDEIRSAIRSCANDVEVVLQILFGKVTPLMKSDSRRGDGCRAVMIDFR
jgi:hypothetical protein